jgi:hypothetical protein
MTFILTDTQLSSEPKETWNSSKILRDFFFIFKFLNSTPLFLSTIKYTGIDLCFKYAFRKLSRGMKSGERESQNIWNFNPVSELFSERHWSISGLWYGESLLCWNLKWRWILKDTSSSCPLNCVPRWPLDSLQLVSVKCGGLEFQPTCRCWGRDRVAWGFLPHWTCSLRILVNPVLAKRDSCESKALVGHKENALAVSVSENDGSNWDFIEAITLSGPWRWGSSIDWGCLRTECWGD